MMNSTPTAHVAFSELFIDWKKKCSENAKMKVFLQHFADGKSLRGCSKEKIIGIFEVLQNQARDLLIEVDNEH